MQRRPMLLLQIVEARCFEVYVLATRTEVSDDAFIVNYRLTIYFGRLRLGRIQHLQRKIIHIHGIVTVFSEINNVL
jgi:hypothetical protein